MNPARELTRRHFLGLGCSSLGAAAFSALLGAPAGAAALSARAKRVIFIHLAGGPSQLELFDYKPLLAKMDGQLCPSSLLAGQRFAFIRGTPELLGPQATFAQHGESGAWFSHHVPELAQCADDLCFIKTLRTEQFNHAPAQLFVQTGSAEPGRPSFGSWVTYGLGSANENLPAFMVLLSGGKAPDAGSSIWGSGFLPATYGGQQCRTAGAPLLFTDDPPGTTRATRRATLDAIEAINREHFAATADPAIEARIQQYELAFRMQVSAPEALDLTREPEAIRALYGATPGEASLANNCLLARRLAERGVRFIQLFDWGWDSHGSIESEGLRGGFLHKTRAMDRPVAALLRDLKQRGMLDETLVVWAGEFGRTPMMENRGGKRNPFVGRDHHPHAFTAWLAGGGARAGYTHGETDEFGCQPMRDSVHLHDFQATILRLLGIDHRALTYPYLGRDYRLTDVRGEVVEAMVRG